MRHQLARSAAILAGLTVPLASAAADGDVGRLARRPLPPEIADRDPAPRFRFERRSTFAVRAYLPRPTNQPIYNAPPQPLR